MVAVGIVWFVLRPFLIWLTATYTITTRRLITRHGVITRSGHDIPLTRISDVAYEKDLIDRLLGCGTLVISDASTHGQVALPDIPRDREGPARPQRPAARPAHRGRARRRCLTADSARRRVRRGVRARGPRRGAASSRALEVAAETGVDIEQAQRLWRALGFPEHGGAVAFTRGDVGALSTLIGLVDSGLLDFDLAVNLTRAVGQTMARLSDWEVSALLHRVRGARRERARPARTRGDRVEIGLRMIEEFSEPFEELLVYVWRRHLAAAVARTDRARAPARRTCTPPS